MKTLSEKYLSSRQLKNYGIHRDVDVYFDENELVLSRLNIQGWDTEDDSVRYSLHSDGLFFMYEYQMDELTDLPNWIENVDMLQELINYISDEQNKRRVA